MSGFDAVAQDRLARATKQKAVRLGFEACGIFEAEPLDEEAVRLEQWLLEGRHGTMDWMERHLDGFTRNVRTALQNALDRRAEHSDADTEPP